ncbi:perlucin-like [Argopecten irradians]|uniref:perlucin-like n=1 Tax=Argopecten irradians TaxID=31199 RepID=UPI00371BC456
MSVQTVKIYIYGLVRFSYIIDKEQYGLVRIVTKQHDTIQLLCFMDRSKSTRIVKDDTDVLSCPEGFERHGYRCYKVFTDHVKWVDAKQYCQIYGADLLEIDSAQEEFIVEGMIKRLHGTVHGEEVFWTDGTDLLMEGEWRWAGQGGESRLIQGYTHWADGQPSNDNGNENCLAIRAQFKYEWNDDKCSRLKAFICEAPYETGQISVIG